MNGGVNVDDILRKFDKLETSILELRTEVRSISTKTPHLATEAPISELLTPIPHLKADLKSIQRRIITWIVAGVLTDAALAFIIARFVY